MTSFTTRTRNLRAICSLVTLSCLLTGAALTAASALAEGGPDIIGHIYCVAANVKVDVTNTIFTSQGQTYAVINGANVAVVLNATNKTVTTPAGVQIGYIAAGGGN